MLLYVLYIIHQEELKILSMHKQMLREYSHEMMQFHTDNSMSYLLACCCASFQ